VAEAESSKDASNDTEEDQAIALRPLNMEDMRHAKNKVCWTNCSLQLLFLFAYFSLSIGISTCETVW
jgi:hypothetical protein